MIARIYPFALTLLAWGAQAQTVGLSGPEAGCPGVALLRRELPRALQRHELARPGASAAIAVRVTDQGASYEVEVDGRRTRYHDPRRRCDERARSAAVFVALVLEPVATRRLLGAVNRWCARPTEP